MKTIEEYDVQEHPLMKVSLGVEDRPLPSDDATPPDFPNALLPTTKQRLKREVGRYLYPWKNYLERRKIERRLLALRVSQHELTKPNVIAWGEKGMGSEIFLDKIARRVGRLDTVICFGCGTGIELLLLARFLRPKRIIAYEYLKYERAWEWVGHELGKKGVAVEFYQRDFRKSFEAESEPGDLLISFAVLEHLRNMTESFSHLRAHLKTDGWFAAIWGPMWYSYGGDHIAPELGFEKGYEQVLLSASDYLSFYRSHPRNADHIRRGIPTWLEMGLSNFARYQDYIKEIEKYFGAVQWLIWSVSPEGWRWRQTYPMKWAEALEKNPHIGGIDLLLRSASLLTRRVG